MTPEQRSQLSAAISQVAQGGAATELGARALFKLLWRRFVADYQCAGLALAAAEDLASEAFSQVFKGLAGLRDPQAADKWIQTVARNTLLNHWRDTARQRAHEQAVDGDDLQGLADAGLVGSGLAGAAGGRSGDPAIWLCLKRQLERFCSDQPERAYWLEQMVVQGWALPDLAAALGRTAGATREYLSQCRKALQRYFSECVPQGVAT